MVMKLKLYITMIIMLFSVQVQLFPLFHAKSRHNNLYHILVKLGLIKTMITNEMTTDTINILIAVHIAVHLQYTL